MKLLGPIAAVVATLAILHIIYTANTGGSFGLFKLGLQLPYGDKLGHFTLFGAFTFILIWASKFKISSFRTFSYYTILPYLISFIVMEEYSQMFLDKKNFDMLDLLADAFGILIATQMAKRLSSLK